MHVPLVTGPHHLNTTWHMRCPLSSVKHVDQSNSIYASISPLPTTYKAEYRFTINKHGQGKG